MGNIWEVGQVSKFMGLIPFSLTDQEKMDAPVELMHDTTVSPAPDLPVVDGSVYPVGNEMVIAHMQIRFPILSTDRHVSIEWYNTDTGKLLYKADMVVKKGWDWFWFKSWIGHKDGEIDRDGKYKARFIVSLDNVEPNLDSAFSVSGLGGDGDCSYPPNPTLEDINRLKGLVEQNKCSPFVVIDAIRDCIAAQGDAACGITPPPVALHEIEIRYRTTFGIAEKMAVKAAQQTAIIQSLLPADFTYTGYIVGNGNITLLINEDGPNVLPLPIIIAIVAAVIAIIGLIFFLGWKYSENKILKATLEAKQETKEGIQSCLDDPNLSEEQLRDCIENLLAKDPDIVVGNGDADFFGDIKGMVKWVVIGGVAIAALGLLKRR